MSNTLNNNLVGGGTSILSNSIEERSSSFSEYSLTTSAQTVVGAINELKEKYSSLDLESLCAYGVEKDITESTPDWKRIGSYDLHRTLPVHSQMRGVLLSDDGKVNKYLDADDWTKEIRDGSQGQVMTEITQNGYYRKFETEGNIFRAMISLVPLNGYHYVPVKYAGYEAALDRTDPDKFKLCSVVNETADFRGGYGTPGNDTFNAMSGWDGTERTQIGRPVTYLSRTKFREYARNRNNGDVRWNCYTYDIALDLFWLFVIEYATSNTQKAFNAEKDSNGFAQGGLGNGVTNLGNDQWRAFFDPEQGRDNWRYPVVPCGYTDELGNGTGIVDYSIENFPKTVSKDEGGNITGVTDTETKTVSVPRYRGIENPFGHIWKWTDGCNIFHCPDSSYSGETALTTYDVSYAWATENPSIFTDTITETGSTGYRLITDKLVRETGKWVTKIVLGEYGDILPIEVASSGSNTTYYCDQHWTNDPIGAGGARGLLWGGSGDYGANAGLVSSDAYPTPSNAYSDIGSRLCFLK